MARIHPTAIVDPTAQLDDDVEIGPYAVIGPRVRLGAGCRILAHATIDGPATLGRDNVVHPHAVIGGPPQDKKYRGEPTSLEIGDGNTFRECVTVNRGTTQDSGITRIGHRNWVMAYVHVAHDCLIGSDTILANTTNLGGHVELGGGLIKAQGERDAIRDVESCIPARLLDGTHDVAGSPLGEEIIGQGEVHDHDAITVAKCRRRCLIVPGGIGNELQDVFV